MPPNEPKAPDEGSNKKIRGGKAKTKAWRIKDKATQRWLEFYPMFEVSEDTNEIECRFIEMKFRDDRNHDHSFTFDWLNIYMFMYYTCNEELRQGLAQRYERKVNYVPYDISIKLSPDEIASGQAKRRVELPVDELTMAIAREEAWGILMKNKGKLNDPKAFLYSRPKKNPFAL
jgi:hypothetical protein